MAAAVARQGHQPPDFRVAGRRQRDPRWVCDGLPASWHVGLHGHLRQQPGHLCGPESRRNHRQSRPASAPAAQPGLADTTDCALRVLSGGVGDHQQSERIRLEPPDAIHAVVHRRLAAEARSRHRIRIALCGQPSPSGLGDGEHQRDQHHLERVPERVPKGAGQSSGEHRGGTGQYFRLHRRGRHVPTADVPRVLPGASRRASRRRGEVHEHAVHERHQPRVPRRDEPEPVWIRVGEFNQWIRWQLGIQSQRHRRGLTGELLCRESGRARRHRADVYRRESDHQSRGHARELGSARVPQAHVEGAAVQYQLRVGQWLDVPALRIHEAARRNQAERSGRQRAARAEGQLAVRAAVWPGPEMGKQRRRSPQRAHRWLGIRRRRPYPDRRADRLRQCAPGRYVRGRIPKIGRSPGWAVG